MHWHKSKQNAGAHSTSSVHNLCPSHSQQNTGCLSNKDTLDLLDPLVLSGLAQQLVAQRDQSSNSIMVKG